MSVRLDPGPAASRRVKRIRHASPIGLVALSLLSFSGCGEQDLYRPPLSPFEVTGRVAVPGEAQGVAVLGQCAYVPMEEGGMQSVDITDPSAPRLALRSWSDQGMKAVAAAETYDADGTPRKLAFVSIGVEGLLGFDVTSPDSLREIPQEWNGYYTESVHFVPAPVITERFMLFIADGRRGIAVLFQDLERPGSARFIDGVKHRSYTEGHAKAVAYVDGYAYVADDQMGVSVVDATTLNVGGSLQLVGNLDTPGNAVDIATDGAYLFVACSSAGLHVLRIREDHQAESVATLPLTGDCVSIAVRDGVALLAAEDAGLFVIDVRDPERPAALGQIPTSYAVAVAVNENGVGCIADRDEGLIVFRNPRLPADITPPAAVDDLSARLLDLTTIELRWTAPGNDGTRGTAAQYELRWAGTPIADSTWEAAQVMPRRPRPAEGGAQQSLTVAGLTPGSTYCFAMKACDQAHNWSDVSNSAMARMTAPTLSAGTVDPDSGDVGTLFTYTVTYADPEGDAPLVRNAVIDNVPHEMTLRDSAPSYAEGVRFEYRTVLGMGSHAYQFAFDDGHGPLVTTPLVTGPKLPPDPFEFELRRIDVAGGAQFTMGSPEGELGRDADELAHAVTLTRDFYLSEIEVTQGLYQAITGRNPSWFEGLPQPVTDVSWYDAASFCNALSVHYGYAPAYAISGEVYNEQGELVAAIVSWNPLSDGFRLPTEAEWEFACRAGSTTSLSNGELAFEECGPDSVTQTDLLDPLAWYCGNSDVGSGPRTHDAGLKAPNALGLYDLYGNVWEWCWDQYAEYSSLPTIDPRGPEGNPGDPRVRRGGHWEGKARECRSASREAFYPSSSDNTTGFRVARNAE